MRSVSELSEQSSLAEAHQLALVMFNTFRMDLEKHNLSLFDVAEQLFELAFRFQAVSTEDAAEHLHRMIALARNAGKLDQAA